jgi:TonB family protein
MRGLSLSTLLFVVPLYFAQAAPANPQGKNEEGITSLMQAARDGERESIKSLLNQTVNINAKDSYGWTALTYAAIYGDSEIVEALLLNGADINTQSEDGYTPLMAAVQYKHDSIVKMLIAKGADVNTQDKDGNTARTLAARGRNTKIIGLIEKAGGVDPKQGSVTASRGLQTPNSTRPVPVNKPEPIYTAKAESERIEGAVRARVLVASDGTVKRVRIIKGLPYGLSYQAMDAVYRLRFKPATKDGQPVAFWLPVVIEFRLRK